MPEMNQIKLHAYLYQWNQLVQEVRRIEAGFVVKRICASYQMIFLVRNEVLYFDK